MIYDYKTKFIKSTNSYNQVEYKPYYQFYYRKRKVGAIPAGIVIYVNDIEYSSANILTYICQCTINNNKGFPYKLLNISIDQWETKENNTFNKVFIKLCKDLKKLCVIKLNKSI
jgi:hypothetical protein